jgi:hypothetical protein
MTHTAFAAFISPVGVSSTMGQFSSDFALARIADESGLSSASLTATHSPTGVNGDPSIAWVAPSGVNSGDIIFDLGGLYTLSGSSIWNFNNTASDTFAISVSTIQIAVSTDGLNFGSLLSLSVNGSASSTTGNLTRTPDFGILALNPDLVTFASVNATHVKLSVAGQGSFVGVGLSEVAFDGVDTKNAVPEPSSFALFGLGTLALAFARRSRR